MVAGGNDNELGSWRISPARTTTQRSQWQASPLRGSTPPAISATCQSHCAKFPCSRAGHQAAPQRRDGPSVRAGEDSAYATCSPADDFANRSLVWRRVGLVASMGMQWLARGCRGIRRQTERAGPSFARPLTVLLLPDDRKSSNPQRLRSKPGKPRQSPQTGSPRQRLLDRDRECVD